jgi:hypothetical protein
VPSKEEERLRVDGPMVTSQYDVAHSGLREIEVGFLVGLSKWPASLQSYLQFFCSVSISKVSPPQSLARLGSIVNVHQILYIFSKCVAVLAQQNCVVLCSYVHILTFV